MGYDLKGTFIEACDCRSLCPCWVDDDPDDGHCTGMFSWTFDATSQVCDTPVGGLHVVSVSTHTGNRRGGLTASLLFVDHAATPDQFSALTDAFAGRLPGPLAELAAVTGTVLSEQKATIIVAPDDENWRVTVAPGQVPLLEATGSPLRFDDAGVPLTLSNTALDRELRAVAPSTAQHGHSLTINLPGLPAGYLAVTERSGMRGRFHYQHPRRA